MQEKSRFVFGSLFMLLYGWDVFFLLFFHVYRNLTDFYQQLIEIPTWTETVKR